MDLGNWKTEAMMRNYAHLASANLAAAAARIPAMEFRSSKSEKTEKDTV